jgi:hypothetical protein
MRKLYLVFVILSFSSCCIQKQNIDKHDNAIVYFIPPSIEKLLENKIDKNDRKIYFFLSVRADGNLIYFSHYEENDSLIYWIRNTNRKILISGSLYPIIFESDEMFASTESRKKVLSELSTEEYPMIKKTSILFHGYIIKFNMKGEVLQGP